jgi:hypothetical protein
VTIEPVTLAQAWGLGGRRGRARAGGRRCGRDQRRRKQAELRDLHQRRCTEALSVALFCGIFVIRIVEHGGSQIIPQHAQVIENVRRKASSAASAVDEQSIEVGPQTFRILPHGREGIGNARIVVAKHVRLDSTRQTLEPFLRARQKKCNGLSSALPSEIDRNLRVDRLIRAASVYGIRHGVHQPGVLAVDRRFHRFGCRRRRLR